MYYKEDIPKCEIVNDMKIQPDLDLLTNLLYQQTPSRGLDQDRLIDWIINWTRENNIECRTQKDGYGNLYITKGNSVLYPCVVAHVDINQDFKEEMGIFQSSKFIFAFDDETGKQCGPGFDDKAGVCFALQMLREFDNIKVFLSKDEEVGCRGTRVANMNFFKNCSLVLQGDRRSFTTDISEFTNGVEVVSESFKDEMLELNAKYGYSFTRCVYTDIGELKIQGLSCVAFNFSIGYFNEHNDDEVLSIDHFTNAINYGYEIIKQHGDIQWYHISKEEKKVGVYGKESKYKDSFDWESGYNWREDTAIDKDTYHHTPEWKFTKQDEDYIQDQLSTGTCPLCSNSNLAILSEFEEHCFNCDSTFNIPFGKSVDEVEDEIQELSYAIIGKKTE
jgi:tripeptide aminopeptidase